MDLCRILSEKGSDECQLSTQGCLDPMRPQRFNRGDKENRKATPQVGQASSRKDKFGLFPSTLNSITFELDLKGKRALLSNRNYVIP